MYRVYCEVEGYRYYWSGGSRWTMWSWEAKPLKAEQARQIAEREQADYERFSGRRARSA